MSGSRLLVLAAADLASLSRSWLVRLWLAAIALPAIVPVIGAVSEEVSASELLSGWLQVAIVPLSAIAVAIIGAGSVSSEAGIVADAVLSRAVTRYDYIMAKLASRAAATLSVIFVVTLPLSALVIRYGERDVTADGAVLALLSLGMIFLFLATFGVTLSSVFNNTLVALAILLVLVATESAVFQFLGLEFLSPTGVLANLPDTLRGDYDGWEQTKVLVAFGLTSAALATVAVSVFARKDV